MNKIDKAEDIEQLIYRELPPDRYCYIHNFIVEKDKEIEKLADVLEEQEIHIKEANYEIKRLNNIKNDLLYVLEQLDGYLDKGWTINLNFTDIREKYKEDIKKYENWK